MMSYPIRFADQLRQHLKSLRRARGVTQAVLGKQVGVSQARIAELEANPGLVSMEQMLQVFSALGVSMSLNEDLAEPTLKTDSITRPNFTKISRAAIPDSNVAEAPPVRGYHSKGSAIDLYSFNFKMSPQSETTELDFRAPGVNTSQKIIFEMTKEDAVRPTKKRHARPPSGKIPAEDLKGGPFANINRNKKGSW